MYLLASPVRMRNKVSDKPPERTRDTAAYTHGWHIQLAHKSARQPPLPYDRGSPRTQSEWPVGLKEVIVLLGIPLRYLPSAPPDLAAAATCVARGEHLYFGSTAVITAGGAAASAAASGRIEGAVVLGALVSGDGDELARRAPQGLMAPNGLHLARLILSPVPRTPCSACAFIASDRKSVV